MSKSVLIIGEDPEEIDFGASDAPKDVTPEMVMAGLNGSKARLEAAAGHQAVVLLTKDAASVEDQVSGALMDKTYDVIAVGAGLRTLRPMADQFERLMNVVHSQAPKARLAFNSKPDDSDRAALRWL